MPWTFVTLLTIAPEKTQDAFSKLEQLVKQKSLRGGTVKIAGAFKLFGDYDAVLRFEIEEPGRYEHVMEALTEEICKIPGVQDTRTYLAVPFLAS